jgi:anti-sigma regulatory factor (Ser/Thr protein kinase)
MARLPNVRLDLTNRPENVLLVREALTGVAEAVEVAAEDLSDIRTAVTEACNNVVLHAYRGDPGPLEVEMQLEPDALIVAVRDSGIGLDREAVAREPAMEVDRGIGLPVIEALSHEVEFLTPRGGGTEVKMTFAVAGVDGLPETPAAVSAPATLALAGEPTAAITIGPPLLARTVVPRLLCVLAARAHFSTDRISDSQLLADALVAHAAAALDGSHLSMAVIVEPRDIELRVGPLLAGRAQGLVHESDLEGLGPVLEKLADGHGVSTVDAHDTLTLTLRDRAAAR